VQIEYSLISRKPEVSLFPHLAGLGIGVTAYGVLSRGLLSGSKTAAPGDFRSRLPRFADGNRDRNDRLVEQLQRLAADKGVTASQLAVAWVLAKQSAAVPLIGARTRTQLSESLSALQVSLSAQEIGELEKSIPEAAVAGTRYDEHQMRTLDSER
jgi:aryl-alcohol dehydrogenase-like predicted oxidoreductase